jgi:dynein heavy chain 2
VQGSRGVPLIKDWAGVLSEVGDHQSLVASLKTSPYYGMFKVS